MPKYTCEFKLTICGSATVEAANAEDAYEAVAEAVSDEYMRGGSLWLGGTAEFAFSDGEEGTLKLDREPCDYDIYRPEEVSHE